MNQNYETFNFFNPEISNIVVVILQLRNYHLRFWLKMFSYARFVSLLYRSQMYLTNGPLNATVVQALFTSYFLREDTELEYKCHRVMEHVLV